MRHGGGLLASAAWMLTAIGLAASPAVAANKLESAEVTRVYNRVELLNPNAQPVAAQVGDDVRGSTAVQTGSASRTELRFNDETIARLGANSVFTFERGTRDLNLQEGVILLEVPKNAGGATINTAAVTAAVTGTTVMIETTKAGKGGKGLVKFIVLEGTMRLTLNGRLGESVLLGPGQMVTFSPNATRLPDPVYVDLGRLRETSGLMGRQFEPLRNEPFILAAENQQRVLKSQGKLINLNYALYGKKKTGVLQTVNTATVTTLRTDAAVNAAPPRRDPAPARRVVSVPRNNPPPPQPPPRPPVCKPPQPPPQPPPPRRPTPPAPPNVPPAPPVE